MAIGLNNEQEEMFKRWLSAEGIEFVDSEAERKYKERITRFKDAIELKKTPDRVPVMPMIGFFPAYYSGITPKEAMYDYDKLMEAWSKYVLDFKPDAHIGCFVPGSGKVFDILDYNLYAWPGSGVDANHSYQCLEKEYMKPDEYDDFIQAPSHYFKSKYFPRIFGALEPFQQLAPLTNILELPFVGGNLLPYGLPDVQESMKKLMEAGSESLKWVGVLQEYDQKMASQGFPNFFGGASKAPFDAIGDTLRGTRGVMIDIYKRPEKLLKALDVFVPLLVKMGVGQAKMAGNPVIFIPLHKGADGFLSDEQFKKFYWPSYKKVLIGMIEAGCIPFSYVEGGYNDRLEVIKDMPKGKSIWVFDETDMTEAKRILGDTSCIGGNVPTSLLNVKSPDDVKEYVKELIDTAGKDGGFILSNGAVMEEAKPENLHAMIDFTKEYGKY